MADKELSNSLGRTFNFIYVLLILLIIFFGIFVRTKVYLLNAPFWLDECMLSHSFIKRSIWELFNPLDCQQKSPPLFLFSTFFVVKLFGFNEYSFRLIPFLSSVSSVIAFYFLLKQILKNKIGILTGLFIFAISIQSIYYAAEFKSYSLDILVSIFLLLIYKYINLKDLSFFKTIFYSVISILLSYFSYTAPIIIIAIWVVKSLEAKKISRNSILIPINLICIFNFFELNNININNFMKLYWFTDFNLFESIFNTFCFLLDNYTLYYKICFPLLICLSIYIFYKEKNNLYLLFILLFVIPVFTSIFRIYPFEDRLVLYLLPISIILLVKLFELEVIKTKGVKIIINLMVYVLLIMLIVKIPIFIVDKYRLIERYNDRDRSIKERNEIKDMSLFVINNSKNGDKILASDEYIFFIEYYKKRYNIDKNIQLNNFKYSKKDVNNVAKSYIEEYKNKSRMYFIGRNREIYFLCPYKQDIIDLLMQNHLQYKEINLRNKQAYLIYTNEIK